jgi:hypothetical protein
MQVTASGAARYPIERSWSLSAAQRENLDTILRQSVFPAGADVSGQRRLLRELTWAQPLPVDVTLNAATPSGVRTAGAVTLTVRDVVDWQVVAP